MTRPRLGVSLFLAAIAVLWAAPSHANHQPTPPGYRDADHRAVDHFAHVPELGNYEVRDGTLYVGLTRSNPEILAEAVDLIRSHHPDLRWDRVEARRATYAFAQLVAWHDRMWFTIESLVFTDVAFSENRLHVGVSDLSVEPQIRARLAELGIPDQAVDVVYTPPVQFVPGQPDPSWTHRALAQGVAAVLPLGVIVAGRRLRGRPWTRPATAGPAPPTRPRSARPRAPLPRSSPAASAGPRRPRRRS